MTDGKGLGMERCSYKKEACSAKGQKIKGVWVCDNHLVAYEVEQQRATHPDQSADAQATVEALQRERDHAKKMEAVQKEVADNQTWHVRELQDWRDQVTLALQREGGARFEDVPGYVKALVSALDAEREKVKGLEDEGVKLFEWQLALHSLTPGGSEFCTPDACEQWVRKSRTSQHEYIIEQIKQRKGLQTELTQLQALVRENMTLLRDYTFLDAEPPELRAQNERAHRIACELLKALDATTPAPMFKLQVSDEWVKRAAELEDGCDISAGSKGGDDE